jgi:antibiotic biosynthesis monooxygenase (ABM) superfamily enzyme
MKTQYPPKPWKMALLTWLCVYPLINLIFFVLMPFIGHWPTLLRTLLVSLVLVPLMGLTLGRLQLRFAAWLCR